MKKIFISLIIGLTGLLVACSTGYTPLYPSYIPSKATPSATKVKAASDADYESTHQEQIWLSPGKVQIGNYYPGARAEWNIRVHNGDSSYTQRTQITTDPGEITVEITLNKMLYGDIANVSLISDNVNDKLFVIGYDDLSRKLNITGFAPQDSRIISTKYDAYKAYLVEYKEPTSLGAGYSMPPVNAKDWVIITDGSFVLAPRETKEILIALAMPEKEIAPEMWEFWCLMIEDNPSGNIVTQLVSRWLVGMRG